MPPAVRIEEISAELLLKRKPEGWGLKKMAGARRLKAVLIDLSGTLHIENEVTPGAVEALKKYVVVKIFFFEKLI